MKDKSKAIADWMAMTSQSWTYNALTDEQRVSWARIGEKRWFRDAVKGTYSQRWNALQAIYMAFLEGTGI